MKKLAILFLAAVVTPCSVLAWLALRALREEEAVSGRQRITAAQQQTEAVAGSINDVMAAQIHELEKEVGQMLQTQSPAAAAATFDEQIRQRWAAAQVGFAVHWQDGKLVSPAEQNEPRISRFITNNRGFLAHGEALSTYCFSLEGVQPDGGQPAPVSLMASLGTERGRTLSSEAKLALEVKPIADETLKLETDELLAAGGGNSASDKLSDASKKPLRRGTVPLGAVTDGLSTDQPVGSVEAPQTALESQTTGGTKNKIVQDMNGVALGVDPEGYKESEAAGVDKLEGLEKKKAVADNAASSSAGAAKDNSGLGFGSEAKRYKREERLLMTDPAPAPANPLLKGVETPKTETAKAAGPPAADPKPPAEPNTRRALPLAARGGAAPTENALAEATSAPAPVASPPPPPSAQPTAPGMPKEPAAKTASPLAANDKDRDKSEIARGDGTAGEALAPAKDAPKAQPSSTPMPKSAAKSDQAGGVAATMDDDATFGDHRSSPAPPAPAEPAVAQELHDAKDRAPLMANAQKPPATAPVPVPSPSTSTASASPAPGSAPIPAPAAAATGTKSEDFEAPTIKLADTKKEEDAPESGAFFRAPTPAPAQRPNEEARKQMKELRQSGALQDLSQTAPTDEPAAPAKPLDYGLAGGSNSTDRMDFSKEQTRWGGLGGLYDAQNAPAAPTTGTLNAEDFFESRLVSPQHLSAPQQAIAGSVSLVRARPLRFDEVWSQEKSGLLSRFAEDGSLVLIAWHRPPASDFIFGVQLAAEALIAPLNSALRREGADSGEFCYAILNQSSQPVGKTLNGFSTDWRRPFVSTEIGAALPRWEVAAYLIDPLTATAAGKSARWRLGLLVLTVLAAAFIGAWLIWREARRRLVEARQKTDFVSNVSHELRTPLTSIRMFSDLLAEPSNDPNPEKTRKYAEVISQEAGRLTRLINNVLDFSRLERGHTPVRLEPLDLKALVAETLGNYRPHIESQGFTLRSAVPAGPVSIQGDRDRISQVLLNLLSNAEKYGGGETKEIDVTLEAEPRAKEVVLTISDRGPGVPRGREKRIFDKFFRADDALASGVQGSGLGLTLARQIARAHGGELSCQRRDGGGSVFKLTLPAGGTT